MDNFKVKRSDFIHALDEVKAMFGVSEEELAQVVQNGILHYASQVESILRDGELVVKQVRESPRSHLVSILMHGEPRHKSLLWRPLTSLQARPVLERLL